ncbi:hypothetical protein NRY95_15325 [Xanthomonas campestris pv. phormiicola]|nr:hypothetical protein [Xanthomonas campestris pv. phormiicola]UYC15092.1 hypothetical protein NRY95_15325 [Xanthomonas campestris pv. phormiicola]
MFAHSRNKPARDMARWPTRAGDGIDVLPFLAEHSCQSQLAHISRLDTRRDNTGERPGRVVARAALDCSSGDAPNALTRLRRGSRLAPSSTYRPPFHVARTAADIADRRPAHQRGPGAPA